MSSSSSGGRPGGPQGRGNRGGGGDRGGADSHGRGGTPPIDRTGVPGGICPYCWSNGACDHPYDCRFMHKVKPTVSSVSATETENQSPDFFSQEGSAMYNGSKVLQHTLRPNETQNHLERYLANNFVFRDANNVEAFSRIFASVNSRNRAWVRVTLIRLCDLSMAYTS